MCMLYPTFQTGIAKICIEHKTYMIHADYLLPDMQELDAEAKIQGATIFCEMGLDPGLDHIAYIILKEDIEKAGEKIREVRSYGSGIPAGQQQFIRIQILMGRKGWICVLLLGSDNGGEGRASGIPTTDLRDMYNLGLLDNTSKYTFSNYPSFGALLGESLGSGKEGVKEAAGGCR